MAKVILTADWHLGLQQWGDPRRENDVYKAARYIVDFAAGMKYPILLAGDIVDSVKPVEEAVDSLKQMQLTMIEQQTTAYCIQGNHDNTNKHWVEVVQRPGDLFGFFDIGGKTTSIDDNTKIYGVKGYTRKEILDELAQIEHPEEINILMMHTRCKEFVVYNDKNSNNWSFEEDLDYDKFCNLKLCVIGDTHISEVKTHNGITFVSPGSIELIKANEDIKKYIFIFDTETLSCTPVDISCDYIRIRSELITNTSDLDTFIATLTRLKINEKGTRAVIVIYYKAEVPDVLARVNSLIVDNKENVIIQSIVKSTRVKITEDDVKNVADEDADVDHIITITAFVEKELSNIENMKFGLSPCAQSLLQKMVNKDCEPSEAVVEYKSEIDKIYDKEAE